MVQKPALSLSLDQDPFPCGAALQAVRSPRCNAPSALEHCDSASSANSLCSGPMVSENDDSVGGGDNNSDDTRSAPPRKSAGKVVVDLARRSQQRVIDRKRTELEQRQEEETRRRVRVERDKQERDQAAKLKLRRRAEIYALNAILRELQQRKIAEYITAQQQQQQQQSSGGQGDQNKEQALCLAVQAIGV